MLHSDDPGFFSLVSTEFFESLDSYTPNGELLSIVRELTGDGWQVRPGGFWSACTPEGYAFLAEGWKIHVSATLWSAEETLRLVVPVLARAGVAFKLCSDRLMVQLSTSKTWPRTGAGKFITAYPRSEGEFAELAEACYAVTRHLDGPYILSDRPYKDSKVVFYRFGEHLAATEVDAAGMRVPTIRSPAGERVSDKRVPYYQLPPGVTDPVDGMAGAQPVTEVLLHDRYLVRQAAKFSAAGGIYGAEDLRTGQQVIIREARPFINGVTPQIDARALLRKEGRILRRLGHTGFAPQFVDLFQEWEHLFLVQEKLEAETLWGYAMDFSLGHPDKTAAELFTQYRDTIRRLVEGLEAFHQNDVIIRDLTKTNVLFTRDHRVKFIDFEFAYECDGDEPPVPAFTPGYASDEQLRNERPARSDDYYALGALILDMIAFTAPGHPLNRDGVLEALRQTLDDLGQPAVLYEVVAGLMDAEPSKRLHPREVMRRLDAAAPAHPERPLRPRGTAPPKHPAPSSRLLDDLRTTVRGVATFIQRAESPERTDRLWPASPEVFATNPVNVSYGAAGIIAFLWRATGAVPERACDWMVARARATACPPGLYSGLSGAATVLLELGREQEARELLRASDRPDAVFAQPDLFHGAAGWGLANLIFWERTREREFLDAAATVGEHLAASAREDSTGAYWDVNGTTPLGFGHGQAGIATFFSYLSAASPDDRWLTLTAKAVDFEIAHREQIDDRVIWFPQVGASPGAPKSPSMRFGTAGVGSATLRAYAATGEERFRAFADVCAYTVASRITNKLWHDFGLAGFGEFLLDLYEFSGDENYRNVAFHLAEGILPHRARRETGDVFPGSELLRFSCDHAMGSAGIGIFFHRLLNPGTARFLMPDRLLRAAGRRGAPVPTVASISLSAAHEYAPA